MTRPARARIDLSALRSNFLKVKSLAPESRIMAVVKANAYGHGLCAVAGALAGADGFAVASVEEGAALRECGIGGEISVFNGFHHGDDLHILARHCLTPVIHCPEQLECLERASLSQKMDCWIKLDSGMHRAGFHPGDLPGIHDRLAALPGLGKIRFMSHLANAEDTSDPVTRTQLAVFAQSCAPYSAELSLANSAGVIAWPETHLDWVRPGIMLYGASPLGDSDETALGLRPVMTLESELIALKDLKRGDPIGYGATWRCPEDMRVGLVACGYADGYPRGAPSGTPVYMRGGRTRLVGAVSMDLLSVDLRPCPQARVGDRVELWGANVTVGEVAARAGTIVYELLSHVAPRVRRIIGEI